MGRERSVSEKFVCCLWDGQYLKEGQLRTTDGSKLEVTFSGRWNPESGPDFRKAKLGIGERKSVTGDVEVHVYPFDWHRHGHDKDPRYNRVILQVVMFGAGKEIPIRKENGEEVPTLILNDFLVDKLSELRKIINEDDYIQARRQTSKPCPQRVRARSREAMAYLLDRAGEHRLFAKADRFRERIENSTIDQVLYEGIMESLGYAKNKALFLELARRVSLAKIEEVMGDEPPEGVKRAGALLFGVAGLLPADKSDFDHETREYIAELESLWWEFEPGFEARKMDGSRWQFLGVRPANFPTRRLAAISHILANCRKEGLFATFLSSLTGEGGRSSLKRIERIFKPEATSYWSFRHTFGGKRRKDPSKLVGQSRISDIVVNVIVPIVLAHARATEDRDLQNLLLKVYGSHPKLSDNAVTRFMTAQIFGQAPKKAAVINSARRQQGLIHIYQNFCDNDERGCDECPLSR